MDSECAAGLYENRELEAGCGGDLEEISQFPSEHEMKWDWACRCDSECHGDCKHDLEPWRGREHDHNVESIGTRGHGGGKPADSECSAGLCGNREHEAGQPGTCDGNPALLVDFREEVQ